MVGTICSLDTFPGGVGGMTKLRHHNHVPCIVAARVCLFVCSFIFCTDSSNYFVGVSEFGW